MFNIPEPPDLVEFFRDVTEISFSELTEDERLERYLYYRQSYPEVPVHIVYLLTIEAIPIRELMKRLEAEVIPKIAAVKKYLAKTNDTKTASELERLERHFSKRG